MILDLETSCDDTCAAVLTHDGEIRSNIVSSQAVHAKFGGVVPEWASRHHLEQINQIVDAALEGTSLDEIDLVAVTQGPGLVGALLIGVATAKGLAASRRLPLAAVNHLQGHIAANFLGGFAPPFLCLGASGGHTFLARVTSLAGSEPPFLCLGASGGHTFLARVTSHDGYETLGQTLDDAAGEAFDKGARLLGLGYPGGPALSKLALEGDPTAFKFPIAAKVAGLDFSFAGLKTALLYKVRDLGNDAASLKADLAASYEHAIVEALMLRVERALEGEAEPRLAIGGGVAANRLLRARAESLGVPVHVPPHALCTDNAAMIASAARYVRPQPYPEYLALDAYATKRAA